MFNHNEINKYNDNFNHLEYIDFDTIVVDNTETQSEDQQLAVRPKNPLFWHCRTVSELRLAMFSYEYLPTIGEEIWGPEYAPMAFNEGC